MKRKQTFFIDPAGEIDTIAALPRDSYRLVVFAADQGKPSRMSNATVVITVENNNTDVISAITLSTSYTTLFVGMAQGTQLALNMTTVNAANVDISGMYRKFHVLQNGNEWSIHSVMFFFLSRCTYFNKKISVFNHLPKDYCHPDINNHLTLPKFGSQLRP